MEKRDGNILDFWSADESLKGFLRKYRCLILRVRVNLKKEEYETSKMYGPIRGCSSAGRAPALQAGGHRFDPVHLHHLLFRGKEMGS